MARHMFSWHTICTRNHNSRQSEYMLRVQGHRYFCEIHIEHQTCSGEFIRRTKCTMRYLVILVFVLFTVTTAFNTLIESISKSIVENPLLIAASNVAGDIISGSADGLTAIPIALSKVINEIHLLPNAQDNTNDIIRADLLKQINIGKKHRDVTLHVAEMIQAYGYNAESHTVVTPDEYVLMMHRIPNENPKGVVFLMHGLLGSSDDWVVAGPGKSLAFILADEGYDVWMGNARGNKHSRTNLRLAPRTAEFWDFSWHEIGTVDLPSMIDYALNETGEPSVRYIGHSQGTTVFFVMCSERPEYNEKISVMVALSPVAFMSKVPSPLVRAAAANLWFLRVLTRILGLNEFEPDHALDLNIGRIVCLNNPLSSVICNNALFIIAGFNVEQMDYERLAVILNHVPSGSSVNQFAHYGQNVLSGGFHKFDYGAETNFEIYGQDRPPEYNLNKVVAPVAMFYSEKDWLAHPDDVMNLYERLSNVIDLYKVPNEQFNHLDFVWAKSADKLIFQRVLSIIE